LKPASMIFYQSIHRHLPDNNATSKANESLLSRAKIVIACVQNQVKPDPVSRDENAAYNAPMRPIRVPRALHDAIQNAITQQTHK
ncbi:MAG: thioesterase, partial [Psychrobacter sp.]|nr:thioesterase [Psychrobacter sp.]